MVRGTNTGNQFLKIAGKPGSYFKRFQVKYRRRRDGKTDFKARRRLVTQDKTKYNTPKYRFVVRITNKDVICQITYAKLVGDVVVCAAYAHQLGKYGVKVGLNSYAGCYATGLLCARRMLKKVGLDATYEGLKEATGADFLVKAGEGRKPFKAYLDTGLARTTTGARIFACLKGAVDGGIEIPHNPKRFAGYNKKDSKLNTEFHRQRILGGHVAAYMKLLLSEDAARFQEQFSRYVKEGINADKVEGMWKECHKKIRADPAWETKPKREGKPKSHRVPPIGTKHRVHIRTQRREAFKRKAEAMEK